MIRSVEGIYKNGKVELLEKPSDDRPARVIVTFLPPDDRPRRSALEIIEGLKGHRFFQTPEEVDRHLREEREAWDR